MKLAVGLIGGGTRREKDALSKVLTPFLAKIVDFVDVKQEKGYGFYSSVVVTRLFFLQLHQSPCARKKVKFSNDLGKYHVVIMFIRF